MPTPNEMLEDFDQIVREHGTQCRFRFFTTSGATTGYDDNIALTRSGADLWTSGLPQPLKNNSYEALLVEQGRLLTDDSRIFIRGTVPTSGIWRVGIGSPIAHEYAPIPVGVKAHIINGLPIYKEVYVRVLTNGSLSGE